MAENAQIFYRYRFRLRQSRRTTTSNHHQRFYGRLLFHGQCFESARRNTVYQKDFTPPPLLLERLENFRANTAYPGPLFDNYIEIRVGMVNFSVLGRNCPYTERERYGVWDKAHHERTTIQKKLLEEFPDLDIAVGGSISMDLTPKGCGKGQISRHLRETYPDEEIVFFGDKTFKGGNDYELAQELATLSATKTVQVDDPDFVLTYLEADT